MRCAMRIYSPGAIIGIVALLLGGCLSSGSGGNGGNGEAVDDHDAGPVDAGFDLGGVTLIADSAPSLDHIEVLGLPENVGSEDLYAAFQPVGSDSHPMTAEDNERRVPLLTIDENVVMVTPLVDPDGDVIELVITDGESRSQLIELTLEPLPPPQQGDVTGIVNSFDVALQSATEAMGRTYPDDLEYWRDQGFNLMPEVLLPVIRPWRAIVDPENPNSLASRAQLLDNEERELLERVLATRDINGMLAELVVQIESGNSFLDHAAHVTALQRPASDQQTMASLATSDLAGVRVDGSAFITIDGPEALSDWMEKYADARQAQQRLELFSDVFGTYVMFAGLATGGTTTAASRVLLTTEAATKIAESIGELAEATQWLVPCCITEVESQLDPQGGVIEHEDAEPNQLAVESVRVTAESEGVDLVREIVERAANKLKENGMDPAMEAFLTKEGAGAVNEFVVDPKLEAWLDGLDGFELVFVWEDIEFVDERPQHWLNHEFDAFGSSQQEPWLEVINPVFGEGPYAFELVVPAAFESTEAFIRLWPDIERFSQGSWSPVVKDTRALTFNHIELDITLEERPDRSVVALNEGESVTFHVTVRNALDIGVTDPLLRGPGEITFSEATSSDDHHYEIDYRAPNELPEGESTAEISMISTSTDGIRGSPQAPRRPGRSVVLFSGDEEKDEEEDGANETPDSQIPPYQQRCEIPAGEPYIPVWPELHGGYASQELVVDPNNYFLTATDVEFTNVEGLPGVPAGTYALTETGQFFNNEGVASFDNTGEICLFVFVHSSGAQVYFEFLRKEGGLWVPVNIGVVDSEDDRNWVFYPFSAPEGVPVPKDF